jgi:hypothetical protein
MVAPTAETTPARALLERLLGLTHEGLGSDGAHLVREPEKESH